MIANFDLKYPGMIDFTIADVRAEYPLGLSPMLGGNLYSS